MTVNGFVAGVRRKKADGVITPVIVELLALKGAVRAHFVKLKNRHQLNGVDSQLLEVGNLFADTGKGAAVLNAGALVHRKASDVKLINNQFLKRNRGRLKVAPVVVLKHHARLVDALILLRLAPAALTGDRLGVGVEDIFCLVKHQTLFGVVGTVDRVGVFKLVDLQTEYDHGVGVADTVGIGKGQTHIRRSGSRRKQKQRAGGGIDGTDREIHAAAHRTGTLQIIVSGPYVITANNVSGL